MKHYGKLAAMLISSAAALTLGTTAFADEITQEACANAYQFDAVRINYSGENAAFGVDFPKEYADTLEISDKGESELATGETYRWLFTGECDSGSVSSAFHENLGGYEKELEMWTGEFQLYTGTDADGYEYNVVELSIYGSNAFLAEFKWDEDIWLNISMSFPEDKMDEYRDDVIAMFGTFKRADFNGEAAEVVSAAQDEEPVSDGGDTDNAEQTAQTAVTSASKGSPDTGAEFPAAVAAIGAMAVGIAFLTKKQ
jgi:hypothetical protein